jgi:rhodanese-related sulfurtransferase
MERLLEYASHHPYLSTAAAALAALVIVFEMRARAENFASLSPQEVIRLANQGALVLDLRPQEQFVAGHVAGARQMSGDQILKAAETLKKHKEKPVIVYDDSGSLGASAVRQLVAQGFTKAFNLRGGLAAWRAENLPLSKG